MAAVGATLDCRSFQQLDESSAGFLACIAADQETRPAARVRLFAAEKSEAWRQQGTENHEPREIPMTDALRSLLLRVREERNPAPPDSISEINSAKKCLATACHRLSYPHFTHHDFRHFFPVTCIESGVDIPTVSRWLGHKDGGALAMRVYGRLRQKHSLAAVKRVRF